MTNDFEAFVRLNTSGVYLESKGTSIHGLSIDGQCPITDGCYIEAFMRMRIDQCIDHPELYPTFRCQFSDGSRLSFTSEKSIRLKKGKSIKRHSKGNRNLNKILVYYNYGYYGSRYLM